MSAEKIVVTVPAAMFASFGLEPEKLRALLAPLGAEMIVDAEAAEDEGGIEPYIPCVECVDERFGYKPCAHCSAMEDFKAAYLNWDKVEDTVTAFFEGR